VEGVFEEFEGASEIALPARDVADEEHVKGAVPRGIEHGRHFGAAIDRASRMSCCPEEAGIEEAESAD
jgi:hypothetical protein